MNKLRKPPKRKPVVQSFVEIIKEQMELQGITRSQLSTMAKVGKPYLYRVLKGEQVPSFDWAEKVGSVLGIKINFEKVP